MIVLYLIVAVLNLAVFVYFLYICFQAVKLVRHKLSPLATMVFVLGLFYFVIKPGSDRNSAQEVKRWTFDSKDHVSNSFINTVSVPLEDNFISKYTLSIVYGKATNAASLKAIEASSITSGWESGTRWNPASIQVSAAGHNKLSYHVFGTVDWSILGIIKYSQGREFKGVIDNLKAPVY